MKISRPTRPSPVLAKINRIDILFLSLCFFKPAPPAHKPARRGAFGAGGASGARISAFLAEKFWRLALEQSRAGLSHSTLGALQTDYPQEPGSGPEQEVYLNRKKKVVNTSIYPDEVIEHLARCFYPAILECFNSEEGQRAFAAWQAEQARLTSKEKQDVPAGERPAIHRRLFSAGCVLRGAPIIYGSLNSIFFSGEVGLESSSCDFNPSRNSNVSCFAVKQF